jgi:tetratricopeptide (TPR) repeat protein
MFYLARLYKEQCPQCFYAIGCSLSARGQYDRAIYCFQRTLDLDDEHSQAHVRIAEAQWGKGELEQARRNFLTALRQDPGDTDILLNLGELLAEMGRLDEAGEKYRRAIELKPDIPPPHYCLGCWLMRMGRPAEAKQSFERALELDPTFGGAHLRLAQMCHRRRDVVGMQSHLRAELLLRPDDAAILRDLADLLLDTGDARAAVVCLRRLVQIDGDDGKAWQNLGVAQFLIGRYADGIASSRLSLRRDPQSTAAMHNVALAYCHLKQYKRAMLWTRRGLKLSPRDRSLHALHLRLIILRAAGRVRGWMGK